MAYFFNANEEIEFKRINGRLLLYVIHRDHAHRGMKPHAHVLDISELKIGQTEVEREINQYCGMAKEVGQVIPY